MEDQGIIYAIKSKYIVKHLLGYIQDKNYEIKLFYCSKYFRKRLEINLLNYFKKCLDHVGFSNKYLYKKEEHYQKNILEIEFNVFLDKYFFNKKIFLKYLYEFLNNQIKTDIDNYINIDSPLFETISKTKDFYMNYSIFISQKNIDDYYLKNDYQIKFNTLNKSNINYSVYYKYKDSTKLSYLKQLNIISNNLRKLNLINQGNDFSNTEISKNILNFFQNLDELEFYGNSIIFNQLDKVTFKNLKN